MANYVLEILDGDRAGEVQPVGGARLRIGRKPGNDIVLADEKTSGVHCEIAAEGDRFVLKDLGSTNGTFLDGKRVTEIVLTPGDVVTVGRLRVRFRDAADGTAVPTDSGEFAVKKLDAGRVQRRGGSIGLVAVLVLLAAGGGGWFWWQGQQEAATGGGGPVRKKGPLVVAGNRLDVAVAGCEAEDGWDLRAGGQGFRSGGSAHTGTGAFVASRVAEGEAAEADFAVMRLANALPVFAGRALTVAAHVRTSGGARVGVRARLASENPDAPFHFVDGTRIVACDDGWQRLEAQVAVPTGCDRLAIEVVALLPNGEAEATVDDVAVTEGGAATAIEVRLAESGQTAFGTGASLAVRSTDADNPATVLAVLPDPVPAAFVGFQKDGECTLSDVGGTLSCTAAERSFSLGAVGVEGIALLLPADAAGGLMVAGADGRFRSSAADAEFEVQQVLFGSNATRALLRFAAPTRVRGQLGGGLYRLAAAATEAELVLGFRAERQRAAEFLRQAEAAAREGRPGAALDALAELVATAPMDSEVLGKAQSLRSDLVTAQAAAVQRLTRDLEEARFFTTRGGFERVRAGVDDLVDLYGEHNVEDVASVRALQQAAEQQLASFALEQQAGQRQRLADLADAFASVGQDALQQLVKGYIDRHLPAPAGGGEDGGR